MREQERRLLRCIGQIDDELILEADAVRFHPRRWSHLLALAACLALVLAIPAGLKRLNAGQTAQVTVGQQPSQVAGDGEAKEHASKTDPAEGILEDYTAVEPNYGTAEILREESIGGLYLGMPESEVEALLGQPWNPWAETWTGNDGFERVTWRYDTGTPNQHSDYDLNLEFIDLGQGWILNQIHVLTACTLPLSSGVSTGSTVEEVQSAITGAGGVNNYETYPQANGDKYSYYAIGPGWTPGASSWSGLLFEFYNGEVIFITFGPWVIDSEPPLPYDLTSNEITIYQWIDKQWQTTTVIDKAAKYLCTVLTISEPEAPNAEKDGIPLWLDFGNGTALELYAADHAAVFTYEGRFDPDQTDGLTWHLSGVFPGLDNYVAKALANPTETWDNASLDEAPAAEPEAEP